MGFVGIIVILSLAYLLSRENIQLRLNHILHLEWFNGQIIPESCTEKQEMLEKPSGNPVIMEFREKKP